MQVPMETAPLDANDTAVGYELDTITMRDIASVRYVRHHEWLGHLLGSALPTARIHTPKIESRYSTEELEAEAKRLEEEVERLREEQTQGWQFHVNPQKAKVLSEELVKLRSDFGEGVSDQAITNAEQILGKKVITAPVMRPVRITYERKEPPEPTPTASGNPRLDADENGFDHHDEMHVDL